MVKEQNLLVKLKANKSNIKFADLVKILESAGFREQNIVGSHHTFGKLGYLLILIVKPHGNNKTCHPKDVNKVIRILETIEDSE